jgi:hypothetical protein
MPNPVELSPTTQSLIDAIKAGTVKKSTDRETLVDDSGNVVAKRLATKGDTDYYADVQQKFPNESLAASLCISYSHPAFSICVCIGFGDQ